MNSNENDRTAKPPAAADTVPVSPEALESVTELVRVLDQYLADLEAGKPPARAALLAAHPALAPRLEEALAGLEFIHGAARPSPEVPAQLGDFRIVREVGRGGMGVVYEAEQISLKRRVALKVLRFGPGTDDTAMQRFQREAETVATLHHTNIVPIHAIGSEQGVRYYAMQFIEGRNLAELADELPEGWHKSSPQDVARWGLQAAEALAHAHRHGVIHRDIKPSNLILDADGRIWLTDFGLARRLEDATLSLAGALLGTPRYMSPEQASAATRPVDHRTDIYSLGATLYELATRRPIFEALSPHEVLHRILNDEPVAPRRVMPDLPRDLETIILKCLAKDPAQRYATAQGLADDLRAFLENRAISVRPPNVPERIVRWARKHRRTTTVAAFSAGISLVLAVGGFLFWQDRQQARLGHLALTTDSPNLLAEVVDAQGRALMPAFPVPPAEPVAVPAGAHRLRLSASGLLSETWPIEIGARRHESLFVQLQPRWLWPPGEVNTAEYPETEIVTLGAHADLLVLAHASLEQAGASHVRRLRRLDGATGKSVWPGDLAFDETTLPAGQNPGEWKSLLSPTGPTSTAKDTGLAGRTRDLDGDGVGDPVLLSRTTPSLVAVSGATGRVLWWARVRAALDTAPLQQNAAGAPATTNPFTLDRSGRGFVAGLPVVADVNADGTPDFIACFFAESDTYVTPDRARHRTGAQNGLAAISGKSGAVLWQQPVAENWSQYVNSSSEAEKYHALCRPAVAQVNGRAVVVLAVKTNLLGFDARTGAPAWAPLALEFEPDRAPDLVDLDGDGQSEALLLRLREEAAETSPRSLIRSRRLFPEQASLSLVAVSLPEGVVRWERAFSFAPKWQAYELKNRRRRYHSIAYLDGDVRPEIILSDGWRTLPGGSRLGLEVLDGASGSNRWHRLLWARDYFGSQWNLDQFIVGPDLDGDGQHELFAAWDGYDEAAGKHGLFVGAVSGATGAVLWRTHHAGISTAYSLAWWQAGADGWPLLLVTARRAAGGQNLTLVLASGSGRLEHTLPDVGEPRVADFDGDGILDVFYTVSPQGAPRNLVVRGTVPDAWRQMGDWRAAADLDADGFTDLVGLVDGVVAARSGRDGRVLWRSQKGPRDSGMEMPQGAGDFDGDGVPDVLATVNPWRELSPRGFTTKRLPAAFSGKDGRPLWTAEELDILGGSASMSGPNWSYQYPLFDWTDLDRDGRAELLAIYQRSGGPAQISAASGRDGRVLWTVPMTRGGFALKPAPAGKPLADFNGDRVLDLALWMPAKPAESEWGPLHLNVVDGRNGQTLWPAPAVTVHHPERLVWPEAAVADLNGDGRPEVLVTRHGGLDQRKYHYGCELLAVDGRDGQIRWTWTWQAGFPKMWPPVILKSGAAGLPSVCLVIETNSMATLVALDANGREQGRRRLHLPGSQFEFGRFLWGAADVDADGRDELLFPDDGHLCAADRDTLDVRWRWALPNEASHLVDARATSAGWPATLMVWSGQEVFALEGATGRPVWRSRVAGSPRAGGADGSEVQRLNVPGAALPRVQYAPAPRSGYSAASVARQTWPVAPAGHYLAPRPAPGVYPPLPELALPWRRLPWAQSETALIFSGWVALWVAGFPGLLVAWAVRRRSWLLGLLPLCYAGLSLLLPWRATIPAVITLGYAIWLGLWAARLRRWPVLAASVVYAGLSVAILLGSSAANPALITPVWLLSLQMAIVGLPALGFWALCWWAIQKRQWTRLAWLLGASIVATLAAAALMLWSDGPIYASDEPYSWQGAYSIWFVGATLAGLAGLIILGAARLVAAVRRRRIEKLLKPTPA